MTRRAQKIAFGAALLATMIGVAPPADASTRTRVTKLERRMRVLERTVDQLYATVEAQQAENRRLRNADAGIKNTLMCLHAVPIPGFVWSTGVNVFRTVFRLDTAPDQRHEWSVVADDYCLTSQSLDSAHRLMVPVNPPTFFPYEVAP